MFQEDVSGAEIIRSKLAAEFLLFLLKLIAYTVVTSRVILEILLM